MTKTGDFVIWAPCRCRTSGIAWETSVPMSLKGEDIDGNGYVAVENGSVLRHQPGIRAGHGAGGCPRE